MLTSSMYLLRDTVHAKVSGHSPDIDFLRHTRWFWDPIGNVETRLDIVFNHACLQGKLHIGFDTRDATFKIDAEGFHVVLSESVSRKSSIMR